ncbi:MAG: polysaccharide deacetylase family protein [Clostridia bacterium]|nr:polysaccharide deacetylase family protein [Clostridia bacterium]
MFFVYQTNKRKLIVVFALILATVFSVISLFSTGAYAVFNGSTLKKLPIYGVETSEKKIAISFDCAWGVDYTDKLLAVMKTENVHCTFFMVEFWVNKYPDYVKKISDNGHEIGTHSSTHPHMSKLDKTAIEKELSSSKTAIENIIGKSVSLFRPPYGDYNDLLIDTCFDMGLTPIQWSIDSLDWKNLSSSEITQRVVKKVSNGAIVLFHNQGLHTAEALPQIIHSIKQMGYKFVPIGELIYKDNYHINQNGYQVKNS